MKKQKRDPKTITIVLRLWPLPKGRAEEKGMVYALSNKTLGVKASGSTPCNSFDDLAAVVREVATRAGRPTVPSPVWETEKKARKAALKAREAALHALVPKVEPMDAEREAAQAEKWGY